MTSTLQAELDNAMYRMEQVEIDKFAAAMEDASLHIQVGAFYQDGPLCLALFDHNGKCHASIVKSLWEKAVSDARAD